MRVVVNQLPALGIKTGIGHYTVQLLRCLGEQAGDDRIEGFPEGGVARVRQGLARLRPYLDGSRTASITSKCSRKTWRSELVSRVREHGRACMAYYFRMVYRRRG
jgi:hypothetical protein